MISARGNFFIVKLRTENSIAAAKEAASMCSPGEYETPADGIVCARVYSAGEQAQEKSGGVVYGSEVGIRPNTKLFRTEHEGASYFLVPWEAVMFEIVENRNR